MTEPSPVPRPSAKGGKTAVLIGHPGIGDLVWHLPPMQAIARHHGGPVTLFARSSSQSHVLFAKTPEIDQVVLYERKQGREYFPALFDLTAKLRRGGFQRVYILNRRLMLAAATAMAGIPERYGFGKSNQRLFLNRGGYLYDSNKVVPGGPVIECRIFLGRNGIHVSDVTPRIESDPATRADVRQRFEGLPRPWIALAITVNDEPRRWPGPYFADLAMRLRAQTGGTVFLHGGPHHTRQVDEVLAALPADHSHIIDLSRAGLTFGPIMALLAESDLFVGNDSGPLNVTAALGRPAYGLFGNVAPHESLSPNIQPILPATGQPDLETGMQRLTVDHVMREIAPVLAELKARPLS